MGRYCVPTRTTGLFLVGRSLPPPLFALSASQLCAFVDLIDMSMQLCRYLCTHGDTDLDRICTRLAVVGFFDGARARFVRIMHVKTSVPLRGSRGNAHQDYKGETERIERTDTRQAQGSPAQATPQRLCDVSTLMLKRVPKLNLFIPRVF